MNVALQNMEIQPIGAVVARRALLCAAPACLAATMATVHAQQTTPIMALFAQWKAAHDIACSVDQEEPTVLEACAEMTRLEHAMIALPSQSANDLAAKIASWSSFNDLGLDGRGSDVLWDEVFALVGGKC